MWDKNLEKFVAKGDDSETESSFKSAPAQSVTPKTSSSQVADEYDDEDPF